MPPAPRRLRNLCVGAAVACAVLVSWGSAAAGTAATPAALAAPATPASGASSGCGHAAAAGLKQAAARDGAGRSRTYLIEVPDGYTAAQPLAITFVFHGSGGSGAKSRSWGLEHAAGAASVFVYPDGIEFQRFGIGWDDTGSGYDLPFFDHMLADAQAAYCIDPGRVFVAGFSWGGDFALALACHRGDVLAAVAINSAGDEFKVKSDHRTYAGLPCPTQRHPRVRFEHAAGADSEYPAPLFATTTRLLQDLNGCAATTAPGASDAVEHCITYGACRAPLTECAFATAVGHALPPHWAQDTWDFFARAP